MVVVADDKSSLSKSIIGLSSVGTDTSYNARALAWRILEVLAATAAVHKRA